MNHLLATATIFLGAVAVLAEVSYAQTATTTEMAGDVSWGAWREWGICSSINCYEGKQYRARYCENPSGSWASGCAEEGMMDSHTEMQRCPVCEDPGTFTDIVLKHVGDDYLMNLRCPHGYYMAKIVTRYSFRASDRCWDVTCKRSLVEMSEDCTRASKKYLYDAGEPFTFECPDKHALVGLASRHRGAPTEDRKFDFSCCPMADPSLEFKSTHWTNQTVLQLPFSISAPSRSFICGMEAIPKDWKFLNSLGKLKPKCDRKFRFKMCKLPASVRRRRRR